MSLSSVSIQRPVLTIVFSIVIVLFGIIGVSFLGVREYPSVDRPVITVATSYVGANADIIESQITEPLEEAVNGIAGIRSITSTSREGRSTISVEFDLETDLETAANDVRDKVAGSRDLPPDADPPVVSKADADDFPIIFLTISSKQRSLIDITAVAEKTFKERFQTIHGVSEVRIWGEKKYAMRLWLDPDRMAAYNVTPVDVRNALLRENLELPSGRIEGNTVELGVRTLGRLNTPEEFNNLIVKEAGGSLVRFSEIGTAEMGAENLRTVLKRDNIPMVGNAIIPQPGSNHLEIAEEFYKRLEQIKKDLPEDVETAIGFDSTRFIQHSITEVEETIFIAFGLVILIIFLFLRDWRTTIIPVLAIPISLVGTFFIMYIAGFSINVLTLLGIVLAIGLVVDDAIVVLENIYSKIEDGMSPREAAFSGSREIYFAVISTTIALAAVFMPVIFLEGLTGRLFREFGIVVAGAVLISAFVALTLTPMLSAKLLKRREKHNWFYNKTEPFFVGMNNAYRNSFKWFMRFRWAAWVIVIVSFAIIFLLGKGLPSELAPLEDRSGLRVMATAPEGVSFEYMEAYMNEMVTLLQQELPERKSVVSITSPGFGASSSVNSGFVRISLSEPGERKRTQQEIADDLGKKVKTITGARVGVIQEQSIGGGGGGGQPVQYVIQTTTMEQLAAVLPKFLALASESDTLQFVDANLKFNKPELQVEIDRDKANALGLSMQDIAQTLQLSYSGQRFGYFLHNGKQYQVIGQVSKNNMDAPVDLRSLYVKNKTGNMIQLDNVIKLEEQVSPPQLFRYNRYVSATISAGLAPGKTIGDGIAAMDKIAEQVLDESFTTDLAGTSKDFMESSSSLLFAFVLALLLIFLVLSAQFESFRDPVVIMFTVPLAIAGAVLSLWIFGQTLNIFSQIGIIMLIGLVTKNGILIVEFANQRKEEGFAKIEAVTEAAVSRFRPILMTSLSTILGTLPIALALGAGSGSRVSMGIAVVGGLIFATFLTLYVVPAIYSYISSPKAHTIAPEKPGTSIDQSPALS
ncbi:MAG: efflux RND transporter permease subunit [Bacteroidota bacterium]|nr:efflux RND transporter permease subunit [Bacteroidota bacterium]